MGFKSAMKKGFGTGLSPKKWIGFNQLKSDSRTMGKIFKGVFGRSKKGAERNETFEDAVKRYHLTEEDIQKRIRSSKELVIIFLGFAVVLAAYTVYQWTASHFIDGFICLILVILTSAYGFREHFNMFQMRQRRLGCTYAEWFNSTFKGSK